MAAVASTPLLEAHLQHGLVTPPPSSRSAHSEGLYQKSLSPPFPVSHRSSSFRHSVQYSMPHTQSFSALGPRPSYETPTSVPPPAPRPPVQKLPMVSPDELALPSHFPPTPITTSPAQSRVLLPDTMVRLAPADESPRVIPPYRQASETPRRPSWPSAVMMEPTSSTSSAPSGSSRTRSTTQIVPTRPTMEHRPRSMQPPRPPQRSQTTMPPSSARMTESTSSESRQRITAHMTRTSPSFSGSPVFSQTLPPPLSDTSPRSSTEMSNPEISSADGLEAKVVLLGSQGTGKTSIILRYTTQAFQVQPATIGSSLHTRKSVHDGVRVSLQIWDTAGQERFRSMAPIYYRGAHVCVLVYDISDRRSFDDVKSWLEELGRTVPKETIIYVVGNKVDLRSQRAVLLEEAVTQIRSWVEPPPAPPVVTPTPSRDLLRSSSLAARSGTPTVSIPPTPTRSHSHSALLSLRPPVMEPMRSHSTEDATKAATRAKRHSLHASERLSTRPPALRLTASPQVSSQLVDKPMSARSPRLSLRALEMPTPSTSLSYTDPIRPSLTPASPSLAQSSSYSRFSISSWYAGAPTSAGAVSSLSKLAEDFPVRSNELSPQSTPQDRSTYSPTTSVSSKGRLDTSPILTSASRRKSDDWSGRSSRPWRLTEGQGAAEALGEFGENVRKRQSQLMEAGASSGTVTPSFFDAPDTLSRHTSGRTRGYSVGRDSRLYGDMDQSEPEPKEWGITVGNMRVGEVSALTGEGIEALFRNISAVLVDKRDNIERERTLRKKGSIVLFDSHNETKEFDGKHKSRCCV